MKKLLFILAVLLVGGLFVGTAFAQDADVMQLSAFESNAGIQITTQRIECLSELDFDTLPVSESMLSSSVGLFSGFDGSGGGAGLSDGATAQFCWIHAFTKPCGTCTLSWGGVGQKYWTEIWCVGILIRRNKPQCLWCP